MRRVALALTALAAVFRNEQLRRLELAWGGTITAEWAHFVALGVYAYDVGGATAVGVVGLIRMLPAAVLAPFASTLGDRFRRERFLVATTAVGAAALAASAAVVAADGSASLVYVLAAVLAVASTLFRPAHSALLPSLARTPEELVACNAAVLTIESLGTLAGPLLAGALLALTGTSAVFGAGAAALFLSAALLLRVHGEGRPRLTAEEPLRGVAREVLAGYAVVGREPGPRLVTGLMGLQTFVRGALNVLLVVVVFRLLDASDATLGVLTAAMGLGGLLGAVAGLALAGRSLAGPLGVALVFWGAPIALLAPLPYEGAAFVLLFVVGVANSVEDVAGITLIQRLVDDRVLTRVLGAFWGIAMAGVAIGSIIASALVEAVGLRASLVVVGCILPVAVLLARRRLLAIDRAAAAPLEELELLRRVPMFAPLSVAAKEHVAKHLIRLAAPAGTDVIREGDRGDRFYIMVEGEAEVVRGGQRVVARGPGDYFGEIALLRGVPRTATVRAVSDVEMLALDGADFLAAVTGHAAGMAAGDEVVDARLRRLPAAR